MSDIIKHTTKLWERKNDNGTSTFLVYCDGCGRAHPFDSPRWSFDGNYEKPTFSPSLKIYIPAGENRPEQTLCHFHIQEGEMRYCGDCPHEFNGKNVPMRDIPTDYGFN